jgi:7,8-dihydropterin-6-yl-methyl-4-(beta-D-ribofuranosyl)aminobenzene 5'-phosphate synthase
MKRGSQSEGSPMVNVPEIRISVIYDNLSIKDTLRADWGFSLFISGLEKTILFDSGADGRILQSNMESMRICPETIDVVVLSHEHKDHTGGLRSILEKKPGLPVYIPTLFTKAIKSKIQRSGGSPVEIQEQKEICRHAFSSGIIQGWIPEQSLVLETRMGLVLMTGCAHPRIMKTISQVKNSFRKQLFLVIGGFHLGGFSKPELQEIIRFFRSSKIDKVGPCHCTGDEARRLFQEEYGESFVDIGVGKEIVL